MNTVGVGAGSNLQFYNMVIPDLNTTLSGAPAPADPAGFYNTPSQMAKLASKVGGDDLDGSLPIERVPDAEPRSNQVRAAIPGHRRQLVKLKASSSSRQVVSGI